MRPFSRSILIKLPVVLALFLETSHVGAQQPDVVKVPLPTTTEQLSRHPAWQEPLVPVVDPTADDTTALAVAMGAWTSRSRGDDHGALEGYVTSRPQSAWTPAVNLNLGLLYYRAGYFSRAITAFTAAWQTARLAPASGAEALANQAVAELAVMHARVGHMDMLEALLEETKSRNFQGNARVQIDRAGEGLHGMRTKPEVSFRCGPYALSNVAGVLNVSVPESFLLQATSTPKGFSMAELKTMSQEKLGLATQVVKRAAGAAVPVPSVMHFKCLHFGGLVRQSGQRYLVKDPTFGNDTWMTREAVDDESSGYFLIPAGEVPEGFTSVTEEEAVTVFGRGNSGESDTGSTTCGGPQAGGGCPGPGMAGYSIHLLRVSLAVTDIPIVLPSEYGESLALSCSYHQREADRPSTFTFTHFGQQWVSNWVSWLEEDSEDLEDGDFVDESIKVFLPGGGFEIFETYSDTTKLYSRSRVSGMQLYRAGAGSYELRMQDGSKFVYQRTTTGIGTRKVFLSQFVDSWGHETTINYNNTDEDEEGDKKYPFRIESIVSASGRTLFFFYEDEIDPFAVSAVADNAVLAAAYKKVRFAYENGTRQLVSITDPVGIQSEFTYDFSGFMRTLTTPYGTTTFATNMESIRVLPRWVTATDPLGATEKVEYRVDVNLVKPTGMPGGVLTAQNYDWADRNTFYWSKVMYKVGANDPSKAHAYHWVQKDGADFALPIMEWEKPPLQDFIWYNYPGQTVSYNAGSAPTPTAVSTMVEANGGLTASLNRMSYHSTSGNLAGQKSATGTQVRYAYDAVTGADTESPGTDVTKVEVYDPTIETWTTLQEVTAYENHVPVIYKDEQGTLTTLTLNPKGQPTQMVRSSTVGGVTRTEKSRVTYTGSPAGALPEEWDADAVGYLRKIEMTEPSNPAAFVTVQQYSYDAHGRLLTETDAEGYMLTYTYDALDRLTQIQFPDATKQTAEYTQDGQMILAPTKITGRDGRAIRHRYNALGQRSATIDPKQQSTFFEWCLCGDLKKLIDAKGQVTTWRHDIQGRVTGKISPDGKTTSYQFYPSSGQLKSVTLPNDQASGQPTYTLRYDAAGRVIKQDYTAAGTADVTIDSFDFLGRTKQITDGLGTATTWSYHPFGQPGGGSLHVMDGPLVHDAMRHSYTHFGRLLRTENVSEPVGGGSTVRQFVEHTYDLMGRSTTVTTDMGLNTLAYVGITGKVESITQQIGLVDAVRSSYGFFPSTDPVNRGWLQNITHSFPTGGGTWTPQVQHDYAYDLAGRISSWRWRSPTFDTHAAVDRRWEAGHDAADQLESVISYSGATTTVLEKWSCAYDLAGNRSYEEHDGVGTISTHASANRLQKRGGAGAVHVSGTVDKAATVKVNDQRARMTSTTGGAPFRFEKEVAVTPGTQTFTIAATDGATPSHITIQSYNIEVPTANQTYEYDDNGNLTIVRNGETLALVRTYEWDAANRLVKINYADNGSTTFQYDCMDQRRSVTEKNANGAVTSVTKFLWKDGRIWQEQDSSGRVTKKYHFNGVEVSKYVSGEPSLEVSSYISFPDHLGSHREMMTLANSSSSIVGRNDFDHCGKVIQIGLVPTNAGYTNHFYHARSGLALSLHRAYDSGIGRWISADPIEEDGGMNLYAYAGNNSLLNVDPFGLDYIFNKRPDDCYRCHDTGADVFDISAHGGEYMAEDENGNPITPQEMYDRVKNMPGFAEAKKVNLNICFAGKKKDGFAQMFADISRKPTRAATNFVFIGLTPPKTGPLRIPGQESSGCAGPLKRFITGSRWKMFRP